MKKLIVVFLSCLACTQVAYALNPNYLNEVLKHFGSNTLTESAAITCNILSAVAQTSIIPPDQAIISEKFDSEQFDPETRELTIELTIDTETNQDFIYNMTHKKKRRTKLTSWAVVAKISVEGIVTIESVTKGCDD